MSLQPFHLLVSALAGWLNRHQQAVIDYLIEASRVLKEQLEGQRLRCTDKQRVRLVVKARVPGCQAHREYVAHYHSERNHQGVGNRLLEPPLATVSSINEPIQCRE
jgi:hypothetical protein